MQIIKKTAKGTTYKLVTSYTSPGDDYERADNVVVRQEDFPEVFAEHGHQWARYQKWNIRAIPDISWTHPIRCGTGKIFVKCISPGNHAALYSSDNGVTYAQKTVNNGGEGTDYPIGFVNGKIIYRNNLWATRTFYVSSDYGDTWTGYVIPGEKNWNNCVYANGLYFVSASDANYILYGASLSSLTSSSTLATNLEGNAAGVSYVAVIDDQVIIGTNLKGVTFCTSNGSSILWQRTRPGISENFLNFNEFNGKYYTVDSYGVFSREKTGIDSMDDYNITTHPIYTGAWGGYFPLSYDNIHFGILNYNGMQLLHTLNKYEHQRYTYFDRYAGLHPNGGENDVVLNIHTSPMIETGNKIQFFHVNRLFELSDTYDYETEFRLPYIENGWIKKE